MDNKYLMMISIDGLSELDFDYIKELPNFKKIIENSSYCRNVKSIYPSLTYPAHTSIVTGCYPYNHGIVNNTKIDLKRKNPDWFWYQKDVKRKSLFDIAKENNKKTASLLWPVTAKGDISYNMPEIFSNRKYTNQIIVSALSGSLMYQLKLNRLFGKLRNGLEEPNLGDFLQQCLLYTIKNYNADYTFVHFTGLDSLRHKYGFYDKRTFEELKRDDKRLGEIIKALKNKNIFNETVFVILGDHSSIDVEKVIYLNSIFYKKGYITLKNNTIIDYKVLAKTCDGSSYIYIKDRSLTKEVEDILYSLKNDEKSGIEEIYNNTYSLKFGFDKNADYIIEAKKGYYFNDDIKDKYMENVENISDSEHKIFNSHGYSPDKGKYKTVFIVKANKIKKNFQIDKMSLVDIAPTISELLGYEMENTDGKILKKVFI